MKKRILSLWIALVMMMSLLPTMAFAESCEHHITHEGCSYAEDMVCDYECEICETNKQQDDSSEEGVTPMVLSTAVVEDSGISIGKTQNKIYNKKYYKYNNTSNYLDENATSEDYDLYYNAETKTLDVHTAALQSVKIPGGTTLNLVGESTITKTIQSVSDGDIIIKGDGSLTSTSSSEVILIPDKNSGQNVNGNIIIQGNVTLNLNNTGGICNKSSSAEYGDILIKENATINAKINSAYYFLQTTIGDIIIRDKANVTTNGRIYTSGDGNITVSGYANLTMNVTTSNAVCIQSAKEVLIDEGATVKITATGTNRSPIESGTDSITIKGNVTIVGDKGLIDGAVKLEGANLELSSLETAFAQNPNLSYNPCYIMKAGESKDAATEIKSLDNARKSHYFKIEPASSHSYVDGACERCNASAPTYTVAVNPEIVNGTVIADKISAMEKAEVLLTVTPNNGYQLKSLTYALNNGAATAINDTKFNMPAGDVTINAEFEAIEYGITYDLKGGSVSGENPVNYTIESENITLIPPTRAGYDFVGWTGTDLTEATKNVTIVKGTTGERTYIATWTPSTGIAYKVEYYLMETDGTYSGTATYTDNLSGTTAENVTAPTKTYEGFVYDSANVNNVESGEISGEDTLVLKQYYARKQITITFDTNGGTEIVPIQQYYGTAVTAPAEPTKSGYSFAGWDIEIPSTMPAEDMTIAAQWNKNKRGSSSKSTSVKVPISGDEETIHVDVKASKDKAVIDYVDLDHLDEVIGDHVDTGTVTIDFSGLDKDLTEVEIPADAVHQIAEAVADPTNDAKSLEVVFSDGTSIEFDAVALGEKSSQADGLDITISILPSEKAKPNKAQEEAVGGRPFYDISVTSGGEHISDMGGKITVHAPYELKKGEKADGIVVYYVDDHGNKERCETSYDARRKRVNWKTDHLSLYMIAYEEVETPIQPVVPAENPFKDVSEKDWFYKAVMFVSENGLMSGVDADNFGPYWNTTRGMITTILWRMEGKPEAGAAPFTDVDADMYYADAIAWAAENGIVSGYDAVTFGPEDNITREQLASILFRYAKYKGYDVSVGEDTNILSYEDAFSISEYAIPAMQWACGAGIISGNDDGTLNPGGHAQRAHAAQMLMKFLENTAK